MSKTHLTTTRFAEFPLHPKLLQALHDKGFEFCTPIQAQSLPLALAGQDVAGQAQTGTGKTIAFLVAAMQHLLNHPEREGRPATAPRVVVMAPTRELAIQIYHDAELLAKLAGLKLALVYGGEGYDSQRAQIDRGCDLLIGTTGRMLDYYRQGAFSLAFVDVVVLDEADRMFDLGFIKDIRYLLKRMPEPATRLNLLFSATLSQKVRELAYEHMNDPRHVHIEPEKMTGERIRQELFYPSQRDKMRLLQTIIEEEWPDKAIIFANTKHESENIYAYLAADGQRAGLLTGDVPQRKRVKILEQFTNGELDLLIATDVAARGLHIPAVTHVFNYDLPDDCEDYVHRIGRTGRAGASGHAISFACERYAINLPAIEDYIGHAIPVSQYDPAALLTDLPPPLRINRPRGANSRPSQRLGGGGGGRSRRR